MVLFDALVACLIFKIFGENGLWCLAITCIVTILRTCGNVNKFYDGVFNEYVQELLNDEEEDK